MKTLLGKSRHMKNIMIILTAVFAVSALEGCRAQSRKLEAPVISYSESEQSAPLQQSVDMIPKVDIVIVVDYSTSMARHQANLRNNIDQFLAEFKKHTLIDYQVGVLPIYDSVHCVAPGQKPLIQNGYQVGTCFPRGELLPLKDPATGENLKLRDPGTGAELPTPRYVTKNTPNSLEVLKRTILLGEAPGPAYEESFSPLLAALTEPQLVGGVNQGFYRGKFLITIFLTDSDDADGPVSITAAQMHKALVDVVGGDASQLSVVGVVAPSKEPNCTHDQGGPKGAPKIEELVARAGGNILSLCSPTFGKELGKIGRDLSVKVAKQKIVVSGVPDFSPSQEFDVYHGSTKLKRAQHPNFEDGWKYNPDGYIEIGSQTEFKEGSEAKISIRFTPVSLQSMLNGKVK